MRLDDVVNLIRGPKNSEVRLTIRPAADPSMTKIVSITRELGPVLAGLMVSGRVEKRMPSTWPSLTNSAASSSKDLIS